MFYLKKLFVIYIVVCYFVKFVKNLILLLLKVSRCTRPRRAVCNFFSRTQFCQYALLSLYFLKINFSVAFDFKNEYNFPNRWNNNTKVETSCFQFLDQSKIIFVLLSLNVDLHTMKTPKVIALYVLCRNREVAQNIDIFKTILNTRYLFVY